MYRCARSIRFAFRGRRVTAPQLRAVPPSRHTPSQGLPLQVRVYYPSPRYPGPRDLIIESPRPSHKAQRVPLYVKVAAGTVVVFGVMYVTHLEPAPYTGRYRAILVSKETERQLGEASHRAIKMQFRSQILPPTHRTSRLVERVGLRLARAAELEDLDWEFIVIDADDVVNAAAAPGGKVVVFTGMKKAVDTEDELAAVLGHEVAHVLARHAAERMTTMGFLQVILFALALLGFPVDHLTIMLGRLLFELPNSRTHELEADAIGQILMASACYDPAISAKVFEKMEQAVKLQGVVDVPSFLSTHPSFKDRIKKLRERIPKAKEIYESKGCGVVKKYFFEPDEPPETDIEGIPVPIEPFFIALRDL